VLAPQDQSPTIPDWSRKPAKRPPRQTRSRKRRRSAIEFAITPQLHEQTKRDNGRKANSGEPKIAAEVVIHRTKWPVVKISRAQ